MVAKELGQVRIIIDMTPLRWGLISTRVCTRFIIENSKVRRLERLRRDLEQNGMVR